MKKRVFKIVIAAVLIFALTMSFASCANTGAKIPDAKSAGGAVNGSALTWDYNEDSKILTVNGNGAIPDFEDTESVSWYDVRHSVERVELSPNITAIGDNAFYYFPKLTYVNIPDGVTSIGDKAFAFCSSLTSIVIPDGVTSIGDSCFEACVKLGAIFIPSSVTEIGSRAFMRCASLTNATVMAQITEIKNETFKGCSKLGTLCFSEAVKSITVAENAFAEASMDFEKATFTHLTTGEFSLTVKYVYADGTEAAPSHTEVLALGSSYSKVSPTIDGFNADKLTVTGVINADTEVTVTYSPVVAESDTATEDVTDTEPVEQNEPVTPMTIIAIVIFVVLIAAVIVLAVFWIRSDKKEQNNKNGAKKK